jgi:hypothetical protein
MQENRAVQLAASPKSVLMLSFSRKEVNLVKENRKCSQNILVIFQ